MLNNIYFKITVPGNVLDDKRFLEYSDLATNYPTNAQSVTKAAAFIKMDELKKILTTVDTLTYLDIKYGTAGNASTVPTDATIVVGYKSWDNLVKSAYNSTAITSATTTAQLQTMACTVLKAFVDKVCTSAYVSGAIVSSPISRKDHTGTIQTYNQATYDVVTTASVSPVTTVTLVNLTA